MINKIKEKLCRKKEKKSVPKIHSNKISDLIDKSGLLVMNDNEDLNDFIFYCNVAYKTSTFFNKALVPLSTYQNIQSELVASKMLKDLNGDRNIIKIPFTNDGIQTLYGLEDPFAKRDVRVYTVKPEKFVTIN